MECFWSPRPSLGSLTSGICSILRGRDPGPLPNPRGTTAWPKFHTFLTSTLYRHFSDFGANLAPTWLPTWNQNRPQTTKKSIKKRIKMLINFSIDFSWLLERFFVDFASKLEGPGPQNIWKINGFLKDFAISAKLPTRGHMISIWANMTPNLTPKTLQNSSQDGRQTDPKPSKK